jgi:hypothetical protein
LNFDIFFGYDNGDLVEYQVGKNEKPSQKMKPFLSLPAHFATDFIRAMATEANRAGVNTENESQLKGRLEATEMHLQDLQKITKKLLKIDP